MRSSNSPACAAARRSNSGSDTASREKNSPVGTWYSGSAVKKVTLAPAQCANLRPSSIALFAVSDPSVGIRICLYMDASFAFYSRSSARKGLDPDQAAAAAPA